MREEGVRAKGPERLAWRSVWVLLVGWLALCLGIAILGPGSHLVHQRLDRFLLTFLLGLWGYLAVLTGGFLLYFKDELAFKRFCVLLGGVAILCGLLALGTTLYNFLTCCR